jgi:hypothetical protein
MLLFDDCFDKGRGLIDFSGFFPTAGPLCFIGGRSRFIRGTEVGLTSALNL